MPTRPAVPETAVAAIQRYCEDSTPPERRHEMRVECSIRGKSVTIHECRPPWSADLGEWSRLPVAQLRYNATDHRWTLYWADRNSRWHQCDWVQPTVRVDRLLTEIDEDPTCIFWG